MASILDIKEKVQTDDSIKSLENVEYQPIIGSQLNTVGQIEITIENTDDFYYPNHSYLVLQGKLLKRADGTVFDDADNVTLTNNGFMYLFTNVKYSLSGSEIESLNHPGFATTMLSYIKYPNSFKKGYGLMQCWYPDSATVADVVNNNGFAVRQSYIIQNPNPKGAFSFAIPLEHMFGFCEDYNKVMYGLRHTLTLTRSTDDNNAIFRAAGVPLAAKVELTKISWMMPKVLPSDEMNFIKIFNLMMC